MACLIGRDVKINFGLGGISRGRVVKGAVAPDLYLIVLCAGKLLKGAVFDPFSSLEIPQIHFRYSFKTPSECDSSLRLILVKPGASLPPTY